MKVDTYDGSSVPFSPHNAPANEGVAILQFSVYTNKQQQIRMQRVVRRVE